MSKRAFTLLELLVVILILGVLVALASGGLRAARLNAKKARAMVEIKAIETAVKSYVGKYGKPPAPDSVQGVSDYGAEEEQTRAIIRILTAENIDLNPARIVFLEPQGDEPGVFVDPWGSPYLIALDGDRDGRVELLDENPRRAVAVASAGLRDLRGADDSDDLIVSWR